MLAERSMADCFNDSSGDLSVPESLMVHWLTEWLLILAIRPGIVAWNIKFRNAPLSIAARFFSRCITVPCYKVTLCDAESVIVQGVSRFRAFCAARFA